MDNQLLAEHIVDYLLGEEPIEEGFYDTLKKYISIPLVASVMMASLQGRPAKSMKVDTSKYAQIVQASRNPEAHMFVSQLVAKELKRLGIKNVSQVGLRGQILIMGGVENAIKVDTSAPKGALVLVQQMLQGLQSR